MSITLTQIRSGAYYDSVVLMQLQRSLAGLPGVEDAGVVMATPANCFLLGEATLYTEEARRASSDDLLIVVRAADQPSAQAALDQVDPLLAIRRSQTSGAFNPRSLDSALRSLPEAGWVLISVPGRYAGGVARKALEAGRHVFLYSDNVPIEEEIELKQLGESKGLLVMGPDCGTALINGIGLGFANRVRRGSIGLIGASGTGLQAVMSAIHNLGAGISQALGTGGRDLKAEVGGITSRQALLVLSEDPETQIIVLISKPPAPDVAADVLASARQSGKPVVVHFIGYAPPGRQVDSLHFASSLQEAAILAISLSAAGELQTRFESSDGNGCLRGVFSGGTLAYECVTALSPFLNPLLTNVPLYPHQLLRPGQMGGGHRIVDLGDDEYTQGRLHPMLDNDLRIRMIRQESADLETSILLLDIVLGGGAHPDPAAELAPVIREVQRPGLSVIAIVIGTDADPQGVTSQIEMLEEAGAQVYRSVNEAVETIVQSFSPNGRASAQKLQATPEIPDGFAAVNVGLQSFHESLQTQGAKSIHVEWRPPAGGNEKMIGLLERLKGGFHPSAENRRTSADGRSSLEKESG